MALFGRNPATRYLPANRPAYPSVPSIIDPLLPKEHIFQSPLPFPDLIALFFFDKRFWQPQLNGRPLILRHLNFLTFLPAVFEKHRQTELSLKIRAPSD